MKFQFIFSVEASVTLGTGIRWFFFRANPQMRFLALSGGKLLITDHAAVWHFPSVSSKMNFELRLSDKCLLANTTTELGNIMKSFVAT